MAPTKPKAKPQAASPPSVLILPLRVQGIATFNDYAAQGGAICSSAHNPTTAGMLNLRRRMKAPAVTFTDQLCTDNVKRFAAAAGDISRDISSGLCGGSSQDMDFAFDTASGELFPWLFVAQKDKSPGADVSLASQMVVKPPHRLIKDPHALRRKAAPATLSTELGLMALHPTIPSTAVSSPR